jgi:hypothetical protein
MKNLGLLIMLMIALNACDKIDKLTQFDLHLDTEVTIPAGLPANTPYNIPTIDIPLDTNSEFENNNTAKELIEEARLKEMKLSVTDPANGNFNFLKDIEIYISTDNLPEIKVAWIYDHPNDNQKILVLDTSDQDLTEYLKSDQISIRIHTVTDEVLTRDYTIKIDYTFFIDAKILGV